MLKQSAEQLRIEEKDAGKNNWLKWGPYLSERQWGTVREDYSSDGSAWDYFPHDHARSRTYRWGEDGLAGISDQYCNMCFGIALWNGKDPILKERLFGLTGNEGNHAEDVKELYYYLDNTPTHSYMKHLYKYSQVEYPYVKLLEENKKRGRNELEYELLDTGVFENNAYFDVCTEYAKEDSEDLLIRITITNRFHEAAPISLLPTLWIRNYWSFKEMKSKPAIQSRYESGNAFVSIAHKYVGNYNFYFDTADQLLFTENETNTEKVFNQPNDHPYKKDLFHDAVINADFSIATEKQEGTKFSPLYQITLDAGESRTFRMRLTKKELTIPFDNNFENTFELRRSECAEFYSTISERNSIDHLNIQRQAFAGLLWSKKYYNYDVETWLEGDPKQPTPPASRLTGRNSSWKTLRNHDIMLMPDAWEYPWYAAWDTAFHCTTMALIDPHFAKKQLLLFTKEWYMAPDGQIPAYEWAFSDVNPPVQAWAAIRIYNIEKSKTGKGDIDFLKRVFNKLNLNFTWWVNRLDRRANNVFEGGFLGLDNIGVFDRSNGIPGDGILEQVDGTSWMTLYCQNMMEISLELALEDKTYEDMATKYFGHFVFIAEALNKISKEFDGIWDEEDGFFYDQLINPKEGTYTPIKVRSIAGMLSLVAVLTIKKETLDQLPEFRKSVIWFVKYRRDKLKYEVIQDFTDGGDLLLSLVPKDRMQKLFRVLLSENEFLSPYGIRSLSKVYTEPYNINLHGEDYSISYEPGESSISIFGGNSNWRGPVWFPLNYLFIDALKEYYKFCGDELKFEFPTGSSNLMDLNQISLELSKRLVAIFEKDQDGNRVVNQLHHKYYNDKNFEDLILFYEYFHGDNGRGLGASHQTGWTALVANLIHETKGE
ncbi:glycosyl hydrolase family 63 [Algoriphagus ratkowskyi]|uniref:mannosyl-oligosaccharide glucosidase n=1 Tax=Algoriphagus ratkowskyi TaxID=57028 RepID=A0A2W7RN75_9BACT|nr:glucosidase [Algoriphagus ratkowskyi]PZX56977.1 glycosyl hydrolase family 63 [Algoriphagus ratkowskyi]TXD79885.1 glucosidase [Algoriphagus ratkowskyi]